MENNCLKIFDRVYLINLEKRKDRLAKCLEKNNANLSGLQNLEIVKAVEGQTLDFPNFNGSVGALGCNESHLNILKDAEKKGYSKIIILEDDFSFVKNFDELFVKGWESLPNDWDMLYLFASDYAPPKSYNENLLECSSTLTTVAYAVHSPIFSTLIKLLEKKKQPVDVVYGHLHFLINAYRFKKNVCEHDEGFSDVEDKNTVGSKRASIPKRAIAKVKYLIGKI